MNKSLISKFTLGLVLAGTSVYQNDIQDKTVYTYFIQHSKSTKTLEQNKIVKVIDSEDIASFESLDFVPSYEINTNKPNSVIEFQEVKKSTTLPTKKSIAQVKVETEINPLIDDLDLSYAEYEDQGAVEYSKLPKADSALFALDLSNYELNGQRIAKSDLPEIKELEDRISTKAAALTESLDTKALKLDINNPQTIKDENPEANELVFFNYDKEGEVKVDEQVNTQKTDVVILEKDRKDDGIVFFDYSEGTNIKSDDKMPSVVNSISNVGKIKINMKVVKNTNSSKSTNSKKLKTKKNGQVEIAMNTQNTLPVIDEVGYKDAGIQKAVAKLFSDEKQETCLESNESNEYSNVNVKVQLTSVDIKNVNKGIHNFEMRMSYGQDAIKQDFGTGTIHIDEKMLGKINIMRSRFYSKGHYPTVTDLVLEDSSDDIETLIQIPSLTNDYFENILSTFNLRGLGAQLLVELDNQTEDVELDQLTKYEAKLYLDSSYKVVDRGNAEYQYVLFIGATAGNTTLYFRTIENKIVSKLINVVEKELYYEPNFYADLEEDNFSIYEEFILSDCKSPLSLPANSIETWSFDTKITNETINEYSTASVIYPLGTRKYYELKSRNLYFGRWGKENIIIPDESYISHALDQFEIYGKECMVQLNVNKEISHFSYGAETGSDYMISQEKFLDKDGHFYSNPSPDTKKVFLLGEGVGIFNIKIEYIDGTKQNLQSFCGENSYLIEQL